MPLSVITASGRRERCGLCLKNSSDHILCSIREAKWRHLWAFSKSPGNDPEFKGPNIQKKMSS